MGQSPSSRTKSFAIMKKPAISRFSRSWRIRLELELELELELLALAVPPAEAEAVTAA